MPSSRPRPVSSEEEGIVTVGSRATLPTIYVQNEVTEMASAGDGNGVLRYRNRSNDLTFATPSAASAASASSSSNRSSPSYGTPGSMRSMQEQNDDDDGHPPKYDWAASPDSGFGGGGGASSSDVNNSSLMFSSPRATMGGSIDLGRIEKEEREKPDSTQKILDSSPLDELRRRFRLLHHQSGPNQERRGRALFDSCSSNSRNSFSGALPYIAMIIVLASAAFAIITLTSLLHRDNGFFRTDSSEKSVLASAAASAASNGKYAAMAYANKERKKRLAKEGRLLPSDGTVDSEGVQLGGKRAALNYVHRIRNAIKTDEKGDLVSVGEIYELKKMYDRLVQEEEEQQQQEGGGDEDVGEQRKLLLGKLRDFGHFTTSKVRPLDLGDIKTPSAAASAAASTASGASTATEGEKEDEEQDEEDEEQDEEHPDTEPSDAPDSVSEPTSSPSSSQKATLKEKRSPRRNNPFRFHGGEGVAADAEDDPFRFW